MPVSIKKTSSRDIDFEKLVWEVFFQSKKRGISIDRHFPWMLDSREVGFYILAEKEEEIVGGLVVKVRYESINGREMKIGLIGLVCVKSDLRGQGISKKIIEAALEQAEIDNYDALTLWTNYPALYKPYGFLSADGWSYGRVFRDNYSSGIDKNLLDDINIIKMEELALPPFAQSVCKLNGASSSIYLLMDEAGYIVAEYQGSVKEAALLMVEKLPESWRLNVFQGDPLLDELKTLGCQIEVNPVNLQMWYVVDKDLKTSDIVNGVRVSVLQRI